MYPTHDHLRYRRIISLVPSLTELLVDLGALPSLIGRTRFCIHPAATMEAIPIMGGTKNPSIEAICEAKPDLILCNKEENRKEDIELLQQQTGATVYCTDIQTVEDALSAILDIGLLIGREIQAIELVASIRRVLQERENYPPLTCMYLIWRDPWMSIGKDTYIHDVLKHWNLENRFMEHTRYPETNLAEMAQLQPELILLSSEPYPFKEKHMEEIAHFCPDSVIKLVDGEWFSWYGSRMLPSFKGLNAWRKQLEQEHHWHH